MFWHQVAIFINNNTDVMVVTVFTNMLEVSVYSVYHLVIKYELVGVSMGTFIAILYKTITFLIICQSTLLLDLN